MEKNNIPTENAPSFQYQVIAEEKDYMMFFVVNNQDISIVTRGIDDLPKGKCKIDLFHYIEVWYNKKRIHSSIGMKSVQEFGKMNKDDYYSKVA